MTESLKPSAAAIRVCIADYGNPLHGQALVTLLDAYARDAAGGGAPLSDFAKTSLLEGLAAHPHAFSVLAFDGDKAVGLANCFESFSTFAGRPLVNVHDLAVLPEYRGQGVGEKILVMVEDMAHKRGACKMTLEVLSGNLNAMRLYARSGFAGYQLDPVMGHAQFLQKWLTPKVPG